MHKKLLWIVVIGFLVSGCASARPRHAVPAELLDKAKIFDIQDIRAFNGKPSDFLMNDFMDLLNQEEKKEKEGSIWSSDTVLTYSVLAISGGAANGAFGVGLLNGWTKEGSRPTFKIVTGVSTGAIIAPFAFIGSKYDSKLRDFYTSYSTKNIMMRKGLLQMFLSNSYMNNRPLEHLISQIFDRQLLKEIAQEHNKGRRLYVGTTNLDAQRFVIWDMGKIASNNGPRALELFRKIILASVTIPIVFPPVYFDVEIDNQMYDEMHVDGGATKQVFFLYDVLQGFDKAITKKGLDTSKVKYKVFTIRNGYVDPVWKQVPDNIFSIAERTYETSTNAQGIGDLYQLYTFTKMGRGEFNLAYISASHISRSKELFDINEMRELFDLGYSEALKGYNWKKTPPGLNEDASGN